MWIDQGSGSIIDQSEAQVRKLDDGTTVLDLELSFTDETVAANVEDAKANNSRLNLVARAPIVLGILGVLALAGGLFLAWPAARARPRHLRARAARAAPSTPPLPDDASHAGGRVRRMKARHGRDTRVPIEEGPLRTIGWFRTHRSLV